MAKKTTTPKTTEKSKVQVLDKKNLEKLSGGAVTFGRDKLKST